MRAFSSSYSILGCGLPAKCCPVQILTVENLTNYQLDKPKWVNPYLKCTSSKYYLIDYDWFSSCNNMNIALFFPGWKTLGLSSFTNQRLKQIKNVHTKFMFCTSKSQFIVNLKCRTDMTRTSLRTSSWFTHKAHFLKRSCEEAQCSTQLY